MIRVRSHVREYQPSQFPHRIRKMPDLVRELAVLGFGRHLQATSTHVEQPAVTRTAMAPSLEVAIPHRRAAMRAMQPKQSESALGIGEQHELSAKNFDGVRNIVEVFPRPHHNPVTAKPFTRR